MRKLLLIIFSFFSVLTSMSGQGSYFSRAHEGAGDAAHARDSIITEKFAIYYRFDKIDIDTAYLDNPRQIEHIINYLQKSERIDSITIYAWASPEGAYHHNRWLSAERAKAARRFLLKHTPDSTRLNAGKIKISPLAENWPGLLDQVEKHYTRHDREKVLKILRTEGIGDETRKWRLKQLDGGYTWNYLVRRYMPELRAATWICVWEKVAEYVEPLPMTEDRVDEVPSPLTEIKGNRTPVERDFPVVEDTTIQRTILALKTNLLYDAVTALNYSIEVPVNEHFSVQFEQHTPWWLSRDNRYCLQFLSLGAEFRWWFLSEEVLQGHFLGLHAWSGTGDVQWKTSGCYQFDFWSAGLTYGYAMPIGKHLNLEFSISAGYARIPYQHYIPTDDWSILIKDKNNVGTLQYFGPTKAEISLVIPIKARVAEKGGKR